MKLISIPKDKYNDYRLNCIFNGYKWDPQFFDNNTIARHVLVISEKEHEELQQLTEALDKETVAAENALNCDLSLAKALKLPRQIRRELYRMKNYDAVGHIRLNRYDFHPTMGGKWAVSEVNSDVPGGFAEASLMPRIAMDALGTDAYHFVCFGDILADAVSKKVTPGGTVMFVHCTSYSDDRQVMQYLGDKLLGHGYKTIYAAADHLRFTDGEAISILGGNEGKIDAIIRFTPIEWLIGIKPKRWQGYFGTTTVSCNHPVAIFAQTKRFPFVWDVLEERGIDMTVWRKLLPETIEVKDAKGKHGFIYKPVWGRVGEGITIKEACRNDELEKTSKDIKRHPNKYLAQKRFNSRRLIDDDGMAYHVCLGAYCVEGSAAGYYARISETPRIDSWAADIPVLIESSEPRVSVNTSTPVIASEAKQSTHNKTAYITWAPPDVRWSAWARPLLFISGSGEHNTYIPNLTIPQINYISNAPKDTAVILDLPDYESVKESLALAKLGYRPVPLFNGTDEQPGAMALVDNHTIKCALLMGATELAKIDIPAVAPPCFLLNSNRMLRFKISVSVFDNSWDLYDQDIPSAEYFLANGINNILVRSNKLQKDLKTILFKFQKKGIKILFSDGINSPMVVKVNGGLAFGR